jgi:hypothetical protein
MTRCVICTQNVIFYAATDEDRRILRTWKSFADLVSSARSGCDLCILFHQTLNSHPTAHILSGMNIQDYDDQIDLEYRAGAMQPLSLSFPNTSSYGNTMPIEIWTQNDMSQTSPPPSSLVNDPILQARQLIDNCVLQHDTCQQSLDSLDSVDSTGRHPLPRRLLDLSHGSSIFVIDVDEQISNRTVTIGEFSRYCALSYRWGAAAHDCILKAPFSGRICIDFDSMPQTFKDAIITSRGLDVWYLWIDALCIIQPTAYGDATDWEAEGPRMGFIYQNAVCTIAATCAESADDGFLSKTSSDYIHAEPCTIADIRMEDRVHGVQNIQLVMHAPFLRWSLDRAALNKRGWVIHPQYKVLAVRQSTDT